MQKPEKLRLAIEVGTAIAVVLSLGLVAWELRSSTQQAALNTRAVEIAAYQDLISQISEINRINIENPEFGEVRARALRGDTLSAAEQNQIDAYWYLMFRHADMAFYQFQRGILSAERLDASLGPVRRAFDDPNFPALWERRRRSFATDYASFIDSVYQAR